MKEHISLSATNYGLMEMVCTREQKLGLYRRGLLDAAACMNDRTRRNGPSPVTRRRDLLGRDRYETRDARVRDRDDSKS